MWKEISVLISKEVTLEWRQKFALNGILLYVVSAVFITYLSVGAKQGNISAPTWNALYWIIILFSAVNAVAGLTLILALLGYGVFSVILGNLIQDQGLFILNLVLGAMGFSASLTMVSGIASKAGNNATLMAILSFPVIIPILLMAIRISKNAMDGLDWSVSADKLLTRSMP